MAPAAQERHGAVGVVHARPGLETASQLDLGKRAIDLERPVQECLPRHRLEQVFEPLDPDLAEHPLLFLRRKPHVAHVCCSSVSFSYSMLDISFCSSSGRAGLMRIIQPSPKGSWLTMPGWSTSAVLTSATSPDTGA